MQVITIQSLTKSYQNRVILDHVDLQVSAGSVIGLLGRNGAGKSTLIECTIGMREFQQGQVHLFGEPLAQLSQANKARIGFVPQTSDVFDWLTVGELMMYMSQFYSHWNHSKVAHLIRLWDLDKDQVIAKLSVGQKQRVSIIRALAHEPELLLLDEPVASLDPAARREFLQELMEVVADQQTTIVFSTHIFSDLERIAMDVALLHQGHIAIQQSLDSLLDCTVRLSGSTSDLQNYLHVQKPDRLLQELTQRGQLHSVIVQSTALRGALSSLPGIQQEKLNLEDLFIAITSTKQAN